MVVLILAKSPCVNGCHFDASTIMGLVEFTAHPVPRHALSGPRAGVVLFDAIFVSDGSESESNVSAAVSVRCSASSACPQNPLTMPLSQR